MLLQQIICSTEQHRNQFYRLPCVTPLSKAWEINSAIFYPLYDIKIKVYRLFRAKKPIKVYAKPRQKNGKTLWHNQTPQSLGVWCWLRPQDANREQSQIQQRLVKFCHLCFHSLLPPGCACLCRACQAHSNLEISVSGQTDATWAE